MRGKGGGNSHCGASAVMTGLVPVIHAATLLPLPSLKPRCPGVDGRDEHGHDGMGCQDEI